jgi:hypothetical protein
MVHSRHTAFRECSGATPNRQLGNEERPAVWADTGRARKVKNTVEATEDYPEQIVSVIRKNQRDLIRVCVRHWRGHHLVDLREFVPAYGSGEMVATKHGLCVRPEVAEELAEALLKACATLREAGRA